MRVFDPDIQAQLDAGLISYRDAVLFVLDEGSFGFFSGGRGTISVGLLDFVGSGSLIEFNLPAENTDVSNSPIEVSLSSHYEVDGVITQIFDEGVLSSIEDSNWFRRPAIIYEIWLDQDNEVIDLVQRARREIHQIIHKEDPKRGYTITGVLETPTVFQTYVERKRRNSDLQALIDATDEGLEFVATVRTEKIWWGRVMES